MRDGAVEPGANSVKIVAEAKSDEDLQNGTMQFIMELLAARGAAGSWYGFAIQHN